MLLIKKQYFWIKTLFVEMKSTWKARGLKGLYNKYGLKLFITFFVYYLVRDCVIYLILPWFVANRLIH